MPNDRWWGTLADEVNHLLGSGRFPRLAAVESDTIQDLDGMLDHAPTRHLDGLAARLAWGTAGP